MISSEILTGRCQQGLTFPQNQLIESRIGAPAPQLGGAPPLPPRQPAPGKCCGRNVIPNRADDNSDHAGKPPVIVQIENKASDADIRHCAQCADRVKCQQSAQDCPPLQPHVAIGQHVVEKEIHRHGAQGRGGLGNLETQSDGFQCGRQDRHMDDDAEASDRQERDKADRNIFADQLIRQQHQIIPYRGGIEFRFARLSGSEPVGHLAESERPWRGRKKIQEDLESDGRQVAHCAHESFAADDEIAAHGILEVGAAHHPAEPGRKPAHDGTAILPFADPAAVHIAAADHDIQIVALQPRQHRRQNGFVVLQVGVHDGKEWRRRGQHALDAGR